MKKIEIFVILAFTTIFVSPVFSQTNERDIKKKEYICQVIEVGEGRGMIVPNYDYLGQDFWKEYIICDGQRLPTLEEAVDKLTHHGFSVKSTSVKDGKQIITMSIWADKYCSKKNIETMFAIGEDLDRHYGQEE